jgi:hypothetical protein
LYVRFEQLKGEYAVSAAKLTDSDHQNPLGERLMKWSAASINQRGPQSRAISVWL